MNGNQTSKNKDVKRSDSLGKEAMMATLREFVEEGIDFDIRQADGGGVMLFMPSFDLVLVDGKMRLVDASTQKAAAA